MKKAITAILLLTALLTTASAKVTVDANISEPALTPGQTNEPGYFNISVQNDSVQLTDINTQDLPFTVDYSSENFFLSASANQTNSRRVNFTVDVPNDYNPSQERATTFFEFQNESQIEKNYNLSVAEITDWNVTNESFEESIEIGQTTRAGIVKLKNDGNVNIDVDTNITGNISEYLTTTERITLFPAVERSLAVETQIPRTTPSGNYTGTLALTGANQTKNVNISIDFQDRIKPEVSEVETPSFTATFPEQFSLEATDNLESPTANMTVTYTEEVTTGNTTSTVERTLEEIQLTRINNTNRYTGTLKNAGRPGNYSVEGRVIDEAGNVRKFNSSFSISEIDAVRIEDSLELSRYKAGTDIEGEIAEIERDTPVTIRLQDFSETVGESGNETWEVGIRDTSDQVRFFDSVGDSIEIDQRGRVNLFIYSESVERFNGEISFKGREQHVPISDSSFRGEYVNFTVPRDQSFSVVDTNYDCEAVRNQTISGSGWNCKFFIDAGTVPVGSSLQEEASIVVPETYKSDQVDTFESQISSLEKERNKWKGTTYGVLLIFVMVSLGFGWYAKFYPHYTVWLRGTEELEWLKKDFDMFGDDEDEENPLDDEKGFIQKLKDGW